VQDAKVMAQIAKRMRTFFIAGWCLEFKLIDELLADYSSCHMPGIFRDACKRRILNFRIVQLRPGRKKLFS
jgi:hypothetical protein